jgi:Xaa-Pro aminopeptidase
VNEASDPISTDRAEPKSDGSPYAARLLQARTLVVQEDIDLLFVTPGTDLRYLIGYDAMPLERLTALCIPRSGDPFLMVPELERSEAQSSPVGSLGIDVLAWVETEDAYALTEAAARRRLGRGPAARVAVSNAMTAEHVLRLRQAMPDAEQVLASPITAIMRMRKSPEEIAALRRAGLAIDRVHGRMEEWLRPGRSEREVAMDIAAALIDEGHERAGFVIVASGPNSANPHHHVSERQLEESDLIVIDIGGPMPDGYWSDCTRTYCLGRPRSGDASFYAVLLAAQKAAVSSVRPGVTTQSVDAAARRPITDAGWGAEFVHRTGHGIGMDAHEHPYIVEGDQTSLQPGMTFSVEPGIYRRGRNGARIEDIVVCVEDGFDRLNNVPRELVCFPA